MELKSLADQLNSACEGILQPSQIPLQDELHQRNLSSYEPEFEAMRFEQGDLIQHAVYFSPKTTKQIQEAENSIKETLEKVFEKKNTRYYLKEHNGSKAVAKSYDELCISRQTLFFFEDPEVRKHRQFWKIRLCNCGNPSLQKGQQRADHIPLCDLPACRKVEISYSEELSASEQKEVYKELWLAFLVGPGMRRLLYDDTPEQNKEFEEIAAKEMDERIKERNVQFKSVRSETSDDICSSSFIN
eukprot:GHVP01069677.1.p1 GENE.GHVP01069677.1~~GHVP01069677.1.p1  ORF type:complete len:244 (+),score=37.98 GHVP01069677.1:62-793(+)